VNAIHEPNQDEIDAALEREIETARLAMVRADAAGDREGAREFKDAMYAFIGQRSPQQIERMARERGLPL
jgi:hypothetical protein